MEIINNIKLITIFASLVGVHAVNNWQHCFDIFNGWPRYRLQMINNLTFTEALKYPITANLPNCFLTEYRYPNGERSATERYLEIYKKCQEYKENNFSYFGSQEVQELLNIGLPHTLASLLQDEIQANKVHRIQEVIEYISSTMQKFIESSREHKAFEYNMKRIANPSEKQSNQSKVYYQNNLYKVSIAKSGCLDSPKTFKLKLLVLLVFLHILFGDISI